MGQQKQEKLKLNDCPTGPTVGLTLAHIETGTGGG
jgi:hypothetical protein